MKGMTTHAVCRWTTRQPGRTNQTRFNRMASQLHEALDDRI
jgi:hypothetical protein